MVVKKKTVISAPTGAEIPASLEMATLINQSDIVNCKNISNRVINPLKGTIPHGELGECSVAQLRQYSKWLESE